MSSQCSFHHAHEVPPELHDKHIDSKRPIFHIGPQAGWASDPCGPILYKGRYHMFYQHLQKSCQWYWGLCWDHVVSDDLIHWRNLPPAVVPSSPDGPDADGCFSGTVEFDPELGVPVILYTGVYLKANTAAVARNGLPPPEHDPGTRFVEKQLAAVPADPDDPDLTCWVKLPQPVMSLPPPHLNISCWRDPHCLSRPAAAGGSGEHWVLLLASGIRGVGGAVLRFKSRHLTHGWEFDGLLADGDNKALGISGQDWETPIFAQLPCLQTSPPPPASINDSIVTLAELKKKKSEASTSSTTSSNSSSCRSPGTPMCRTSMPSPPSVSSLCSTGNSSLYCSDTSTLHVNTAAAAAEAEAGAEATAMPAPPLDSNISSSSSSSSQGDSVSGMLLTEPVLAAVAAEAAAVSGHDNSNSSSSSSSSPQEHSSVHLDVWLQQAHPPAAVGPTAVGSSSSLASLADASSSSSSSSSTVMTSCQPGAVAVCSDDVNSAAATGCVPGPPMPAAQSAASSDYDLLVVVDSSSSSSATTTTTTTTTRGKGASCASKTVADAPANALPLARSTSNNSSTSSTSSTPGVTACTAGGQWWFCISPDACNNPLTWWVGEYDGQRFDLAAADGPHRLDLGTTLYAATLWQDPQGRQLLYAWIQEHRRVPTPPALCDEYSYAGCIATPRLLQLVDGRLHQAPLPELDLLRTRVSWHDQDLVLHPDGPLKALQVVSGVHLDINVTFLPPEEETYLSEPSSTSTLSLSSSSSSSSSSCVGGNSTRACSTSSSVLPIPASVAANDAVQAVVAGTTSSSSSSSPADEHHEPARVGLVFKSWRDGGRGAAVLSYDWEQQLLVFDFDEPFPSAYDPHPVDSPGARRIGGTLRNQVKGAPLTLRILVDGSAVEVFTSSGETLTTRIYRGHPRTCACSGCNNTTGDDDPASDGSSNTTCEEDDEAGIALFASGAAVVAKSVDVWEMGSCMVRKTTVPSTAAAAAAAGAAGEGAAQVADDFLEVLHIHH